jgi:hypothetical protein
MKTQFHYIRTKTQWEIIRVNISVFCREKQVCVYFHNTRARLGIAAYPSSRYIIIKYLHWFDKKYKYLIKVIQNTGLYIN